MAFVLLGEEPIDPARLLKQVESTGFGGYVLFTGNVRDNARGKRVLALSYDAYRPLAEKQMSQIAREAEERWQCACAIAHRVGDIPIGEISVAVAAGAPHRAEAFEACRWAIDTLKETVPIWKKETYEDGDVWIEGDRAVAAGNGVT